MKFFKNKKIIFFSILGLTIILIAVFFCINIKSKQKVLSHSQQEIGTTNLLKGEEENVKYDLKYPVFENKVIDAAVKCEIDKELKSFINSSKDCLKAKICSDYNSYCYNKNKGVAIELIYVKKTDKEEKKQVKTLNFCYDVKLELNHIFLKDKLKQVTYLMKNEFRNNPYFARKLKRESINIDEKISDDESFLKNFIVKENSIMFSFDSNTILPEKYGILSVEVSNDNLKDCFSKTYFKINPKEDILKGENLQKSKKPLVALTFDDGPKEETTEKILNELEKYNAHATFFVVGKNAKKNPDILKREFVSGHEIANHTLSHKTLTKINTKEIKNQIETTDKIIKSVTGFCPKLLRAPGGSTNQKVKETVDKPLIYWTIDTKDWQSKNEEKTIKEVLKNVSDGDIILMHDTEPSTANAVKKIIPELINRGFLLVTVSEMFKLKNIPLEKGVSHTKAEVLT